jgi:hypothetical protein
MIVGRKTARWVRRAEQAMSIVLAIAGAVILGSISYLILGSMVLAIAGKA